jgi:uncharacterized protein (TIGR03435 family)
MRVTFRNRDRLHIAGRPGWMLSELYDITAKASSAGAAPTEVQILAMVKALLADRFGLRSHEERRELPVYALMRQPANRALGPRIRRSTTDGDAFRRGIAEARQGAAMSPARWLDADSGCAGVGELTTHDVGGATMQQLANTLRWPDCDRSDEPRRAGRWPARCQRRGALGAVVWISFGDAVVQRTLTAP